MKKQLKKIQEKRVAKQAEAEDPKVPRITTQNVAEHREEVLSGARKFIYPLQHSKHRIVILSTSIFVVVVLVFTLIMALLLYRFENTSGFTYQVTRVIPAPIARIDGTFVAYENYLFELNHYIHYYENQQELSFESEAGKQQLNSYKDRAINKVINDAYIKLIAKEKGISVSDEEVESQIRIAREQNRLGSNEEILEDVLRDFWNWSLDDFKRSLKSELLAQKVVRALDSEAEQKATEALSRVTAGEDFGKVAADLSDDVATNEIEGEFGFVNKSNRNVSQQTVDTLFSLGEGQTSGVTIVPYGRGYALSIIKNLEEKNDQVRGAHIIIQLKSIDEVLNDRKEQQPFRLYMNPSDV